MMVFSLYRLATFVAVFVLAIVVLVEAAENLAFTLRMFGPGEFYTSSALAVATASLTLLAMIPIFVVDFVRPQGSFLSRVAVELGVLSVLWILWLATAADATQIMKVDGINSGTCSSFFYTLIWGDLHPLCAQFKAIVALSFATWGLLLGYTSALFALALAGARRGRATWTAPVRSGALFGPEASSPRHAAFFAAAPGAPRAEKAGSPVAGAHQLEDLSPTRREFVDTYGPNAGGIMPGHGQV